MSSREYTIHQLAAATGLSVRNIRSYRSRSLLQPPRLRGRVGYYDATHLTRLRLVQALLGRGLGLDAIARHVERGTALGELVRLSDDDAHHEGRTVPLSSQVAMALDLAEPGFVARLVDAGLGRRDDGGWAGDPALFALANALVAHGAPIPAVGHVCLDAATATAPVAERVATDPYLRAVTTGPERAQAVRVLVDLATTAYRRALVARLSGLDAAGGTGLSAPAP